MESISHTILPVETLLGVQAQMSKSQNFVNGQYRKEIGVFNLTQGLKHQRNNFIKTGTGLNSDLSLDQIFAKSDNNTARMKNIKMKNQQYLRKTNKEIYK